MLSIKVEPEDTSAYEEKSYGNTISEVYASISVEPGICVIATPEAGSSHLGDNLENGVKEEEEEVSDASQETGCDAVPVRQMKDYSVEPSMYHLPSQAGPSSNNADPSPTSSGFITNDGSYIQVKNFQGVVQSTSGKLRNTFSQVASKDIKCFNKLSVAMGKYQYMSSGNYVQKMAAQEIISTHSSKNTVCQHKEMHIDGNGTLSRKQDGKPREMTLTSEKPFRVMLKEKSFVTSQTDCEGCESHRLYIKPFKCQFCEKTFFKKQDYEYHERAHTEEKTLKCQFCEKTFCRVLDWVHHEMIHTGRKLFECQLCEKAFSSEKDCERHECMHIGETAFKCPYCEKLFVQEADCQRHQCMHTGDRPFKCQYCWKSFIHKGQLKTHEMLHRGENPFRCKFCDKSFNSQHLCKRHEISHALSKLFKCQFCMKTFMWKRDCQKHEDTHTGVRPFKCQYCEKCFTRKADCQRHERIHTGEKPHKCRYCEKAYIQKGQCQIHEMKHRGEKPFKCQFCEKSYNSKQDCKGHEMTHTHGKPFTCQFCEKSFIRKRDCHRHVKRKHTD